MRGRIGISPACFSPLPARGWAVGNDLQYHQGQTARGHRTAVPLHQWDMDSCEAFPFEPRLESFCHSLCLFGGGLGCRIGYPRCFDSDRVADALLGRNLVLCHSPSREFIVGSDRGTLYLLRRRMGRGAGLFERKGRVAQVFHLSRDKGDPTSIDFGNVSAGKTSEKKITVKNMGGVPLTLDAIGSVSSPFVRSGGTCTDGKTLVPNATCTLLIEFVPTADGVVHIQF